MLYRHGFRRVRIVNGHGGNQPSIQSAAALVQSNHPALRVKSFQWWLEPESVRLVDEALGEKLLRAGAALDIQEVEQWE